MPPAVWLRPIRARFTTCLTMGENKGATCKHFTGLQLPSAALVHPAKLEKRDAQLLGMLLAVRRTLTRLLRADDDYVDRIVRYILLLSRPG